MYKKLKNENVTRKGVRKVPKKFHVLFEWLLESSKTILKHIKIGKVRWLLLGQFWPLLINWALYLEAAGEVLKIDLKLNRIGKFSLLKSVKHSVVIFYIWPSVLVATLRFILLWGSPTKRVENRWSELPLILNKNVSLIE